MIDPWRLLYNGIWIAGLALTLAAWSLARWRAQRQTVRLRQVVGEPSFVLPVSAGLTLFCVGLALCARSWWETVSWALLALLSAVQTVYTWLRHRREQGHEDSPPHRRSEEP
jgi:hypothetical protein